MEGKNSHGFLIIMSIVTFIVIIIGASFAYFTAKSRSADNALNMASHFVKIDYEDNRGMQASDLIPSSMDVARMSYFGASSNGQCKDDNNRTVCSIYSFKVTNLGTIEQHLGAFISSTYNRFYNLRFILYNVTDPDNKIMVSTGGIPYNYETDVQVTSRVVYAYIIGDEGQLSQKLGPNESASYDLVLWLNEAGEGNIIEEGMSFAGMVTVSLTDDEHIYGYIENVNGD